MRFNRLIGCAALVLAACSQTQVETATHDAASSAPVMAINDALIIAQIQGTFLTIDPDSAVNVRVASHDGAVTLTGRVRSAATRDKFVSAAHGVKAVKTVSPVLMLDASLPSSKEQAGDFAVVVAVEAAIAAQAGVNAFAIHPSAHAGVVTLRGTVPSGAVRHTVVGAAQHANGVKRVIDALSSGT